MSRYAWWKSFEKTSDFMKQHRDQPWTSKLPKRVKVAILDTGYDRGDSLFKEARESLSETNGNIYWKDFVGSSEKPIDQFGHGTRVAFMLLQITKHVDLWIARVFEEEHGNEKSAGRVKRVCMKPWT
jgi:hypothetical protein